MPDAFATFTSRKMGQAFSYWQAKWLNAQWTYSAAAESSRKPSSDFALLSRRYVVANWRKNAVPGVWWTWILVSVAAFGLPSKAFALVKPISRDGEVTFTVSIGVHRQGPGGVGFSMEDRATGDFRPGSRPIRTRHARSWSDHLMLFQLIKNSQASSSR